MGIVFDFRIIILLALILVNVTLHLINKRKMSRKPTTIIFNDDTIILSIASSDTTIELGRWQARSWVDNPGNVVLMVKYIDSIHRRGAKFAKALAIKKTKQSNFNILCRIIRGVH